MERIIDLAEPGGADAVTVGGKAANLSFMLTAGLPVPTGFCITTRAYREGVGASLDDLIAALAEASGSQATAALAAEARRRIEGSELPAAVVDAVRRHYLQLGKDVPVAVRSSATAEDLAQASFAGQQDTFLNVVGADAVLAAVRRCWASLWNERAVAYRSANGIDHRGLALAVVVQQMIDAAAAGVMFTADPVTGTRHRTVIDANLGLGESVVSGAVNPDHYLVDRSTRRILDRTLGDKAITIVGRRAGGVERIPTADSAAPALTDDQVLALSDLGQRVEEAYGSPQDTEWALAADGRLWLTQARPVTTLYPIPPTNREGLRVFLCMTLAQGLTRPITPMGLATFRMIGSSVARFAGAPPADPFAGPSVLSVAGQRLFIDITAVVRTPLGRRLAIGIAGAMEARTATVLRTLLADPRLSPLPGRHPRAIAGIARIVLVRAKVPPRMALALISPRAARRAIARREREVRALLTPPAAAGPEELLDHVERELSRGLFMIMPTVFPYAAAGLLMMTLARRGLGDLATRSELQTVLRGLPHNVTTEMDLALWEAAQEIRADAESVRVFSGATPAELARRLQENTLPPVAQRSLGGFLRRYGHRAVAEIDLGMPRWTEQPAHIAGVIANYLRLDDPELSPPAQFADGDRIGRRAAAELVARMATRSPLKARLLDFAFRRARELVGMRESPKYILIVALTELRRQLGVIGTALVERGTVDDAADVYFLDFAEVRRGLGGEAMQPIVVGRRADYDAELRRRHIPRLLLSDGTEPEAVSTGAARPDGALVGSPASPGVASGRARVILDPVGARLEPGEILVAPSTDPGWTPLFLTAGGLVMEMGGANSHGAVVAREYGIPAVVGVPEATQLILDGQQITVDGAAGLVSQSGSAVGDEEFDGGTIGAVGMAPA